MKSPIFYVLLALVFLIIGLAPWLIQASFSAIVVILIYLAVMSFRLLILALALAPAVWLLRRLTR